MTFPADTPDVVEKNAGATPETDAFYRQHPIDEYEQVIIASGDGSAWLDFARSLERRLGELERENESLRAECGVRQIAGYQKGKADAALALLSEAEGTAAAEIKRLRATTIPIAGGPDSGSGEAHG